jgi:hypothetical protein
MAITRAFSHQFGPDYNTAALVSFATILARVIVLAEHPPHVHLRLVTPNMRFYNGFSWLMQSNLGWKYCRRNKDYPITENTILDRQWLRVIVHAWYSD